MRKPAAPTYLDYASRRSGRPIPRGEACFTGRGYSSRLAARWWEHVARMAVAHVGRLLLALAEERRARKRAERRLRCLSRRMDKIVAENARLASLVSGTTAAAKLLAVERKPSEQYRFWETA